MRYIFLLSTLILFIQCKDDHTGFGMSKSEKLTADLSIEESEMELQDMGMHRAIPDQAQPHPTSDKKVVSKIIKTGNLSFDVDDLTISKSKIDSYLLSTNAYYEDEQYSSSRYRNSYSLAIRVPRNYFDTLVYLLESGTGKLESKNISAQDVSEEYVDLQIRLKNNLAYLDQYKEILKKAKTIKEILDVQERIRNLEQEIESKKGRIQYLNNRVSYGTLHVQISQNTDYIDDSDSFTKRITSAFKNGYSAFLSFLVGLVSLWPFLLLLMGIIFFRKKIFRIFKRNKKS